MDSKPERFLRISKVLDRVPYSRSTLYLLASRGLFPRPYSLSAHASAWKESEIDDWIASRVRTDGMGKRSGVRA